LVAGKKGLVSERLGSSEKQLRMVKFPHVNTALVRHQIIDN
jgi:hypothetical protein